MLKNEGGFVVVVVVPVCHHKATAYFLLQNSAYPLRYFQQVSEKENPVTVANPRCHISLILQTEQQTACLNSASTCLDTLCSGMMSVIIVNFAHAFPTFVE